MLYRPRSKSQQRLLLIYFEANPFSTTIDNKCNFVFRLATGWTKKGLFGRIKKELRRILKAMPLIILIHYL